MHKRIISAVLVMPAYCVLLALSVLPHHHHHGTMCMNVYCHHDDEEEQKTNTAHPHDAYCNFHSWFFDAGNNRLSIENPTECFDNDFFDCLSVGKPEIPVSGQGQLLLYRLTPFITQTQFRLHLYLRAPPPAIQA
ncbi:MAG: hypothetical protein LBF89_02025 [Bacteroidales bacterium]|jgi:hypothetical protein|nr:hypothetical protein [Bacteroidales bacterium]